ncbi:MAG: PAS domain S-box protein, partial [Anaerolineales bacterium]
MSTVTRPFGQPPDSSPPPRRDRINSLVRQISEAEDELNALLGGQADTIVNPLTGAPILLQEAQQALLRSEARYRVLANILGNVQEAMVVTDLAGTISYWNAGAVALFGFEQDSRLGNSAAILYPERDELWVHLRQVGAGREVRAVWAARHASGENIWVDMHLAPMFSELGTIAGGVYIFKDISERRQAEADARSTARRFQALIENSADGITLLAADGTVLYSSPATARIMGGEADDWNGGNFLNRVHPEDAARVGALLAGLLQTPGASVNTSFRYQRLDESWRWLEGSCTNLLDDPAVGALVANYRDVTERELAEEARRREHDLLARVMDTSPVSIVLVNADGQTVYANPHAIQVMDLSKSRPEQAAYDAPAWRAVDFDGAPFPPADLPFNQVMATRQPVNDVRHALEWPAGRRVLLSINAAPVFDAAGQIDGIVMAGEDVTQRVEAAGALLAKSDELAGMTQQLFQAAKLATLGELAASVAHELNNPLATISLRLEALLHGLPAAARERPPLVIIEAEVERMARLVAELLAFGRRHQPQ